MILIDARTIPFKPKAYKKDGMLHYELAATMHDIQTMPKIEAEPVRWTSFIEVHDEAVMCLRCGVMLYGGDKNLLNYCPHCGAKKKEV